MKFGNNYRVVQRIISQGIYDILVKGDEEEEEEKDNDEPYQDFESFGLGNAVHMDDQPTKLCKEEMEMICVDIDGELHEEELEVDDNNIEEDETHMDDKVHDDMIDDDSDHEDEIDEDDMIDDDSDHEDEIDEDDMIDDDRIVSRQFAPQNVPSWTDISEEDKETLIAYLQEKMDQPRGEASRPGATLMTQEQLFVQVLGKRSGYLKGFGVGPKSSSAFKSTARSQAYDEEVKGLKEEVRCGKNKLNWEKLKVIHTIGSKAFRKVQFDERDCATGEELRLVELYKKTHFSEKKEYKLEKRHDKAIEDGSGPLSDEQLSIEIEN
ncbi:uncharacterized protein LOC114322228 [Camellia sinensis]|uniref:uncharacterized protein LOC114322228 n=1 Tax=Camellia sinensis TaxID=4442 RepID=UPI00103607D7|nr:uncharacterized protein LOC114322228 [Camellia sinensis]